MNLELSSGDKDVYTIGQVSRLLDVKEHTIRFWEKEFPMIVPVRSASGRREYTKADFSLLQTIKKLLYEEGYTTKGALKEIQLQIVAGRFPHNIDVREDPSTLFYDSPLDPQAQEEKALMKEKAYHVQRSNRQSSQGTKSISSKNEIIEKKVDEILWKTLYENLSQVIRGLEDNG